MSSVDLNTYKLETISMCNRKGWLGPTIEPYGCILLKKLEN